MTTLPEGMTKTPYGWPYMADPFFGLVSYLITEDWAIDQFEADTGIKYVSPKNGIEAMVDEATGNNKRIAAAFCDWVAETQWGEEGKCDDVEV